MPPSGRPIEFFDKIISDYQVNIEFNAEVYGMRRPEEGGARFRVESSVGVYESKVLACAIGIFGRPNKPKEYRLPPTLKERLLFDMTSQQIQNEAVLVVGGGDTATEYVQYLRQQDNRVTLSYRKADFTRINQQNHDALMAMEKRGEVEILRSSNIKEIEDGAGRPRISFAEAEYPSRIFDRVISRSEARRLRTSCTRWASPSTTTFRCLMRRARRTCPAFI